jgi:hypothetical protein
MKRNNFAALLVAALVLFSSCQLFNGKQAAPVNPLLGNWKIDSISIGADSSSLGYLLLGMSVDEGLPYDFHFDKDSVTFYSKGDASTKTPYTYIDSTKQLVIKDQDLDTYVVTQLNDSTTGLQGRDSSIIFLKKR